MSSTITVTDLFCGAGGSSTGAARAGAEVQLALNHWALAIESHNANHPNTDHILTDISRADPRKLKTTDILIASPECTNHTVAKGVRRSGQTLLPGFGERGYDPAAERSRATMWDVVRFAEQHRYRAIIVENVVDARYWTLFDAWLTAMHALGYRHECVYFNSMFAWPTPQSRDRMYVVFWQAGNKTPNLMVTPQAPCLRCNQTIAARQAWKRPEKPWGKYKQQYVYICPDCGAVVEPYYYPAASAIDWTDLGERIGDRKKPLKPKTLERIAFGLKKFAGRRLEDAPPAMITRYDGTHQRTADEPIPTLTTRDTTAVVTTPFLVQYYGEGKAHSVVTALGTISTHEHHGLTVPDTLPSVEDCRFRMLKADEIRAAMSFPDEYILFGSSRDKIKQLGNAVTPPVMQILVSRLLETFA